MKELITKTTDRLKGSKLFKDSFWVLMGNAIGKGLSLLIGIIIANLLGSNDYGQYGMIKSTLIYMSIFSTFGLGVTGTKYIAQYVSECPTKVYEIYKRIIKITLYTSIFLSSLLLIFAEPVAEYLDAPELAFCLRLSAIAVVFNAINSTQVGVMAGFKSFKAISINTVYTGIFTCLIGFVFTYFYGLEGSIIALGCSYIFNCVLNYISLRRDIKKYRDYNTESAIGMTREMIRFSLPIALQEGLQSVTQWATMAVLIKMAGYSELGIFTATGQWTAIISFIPSVLKNVTLSYLSDNDQGHNRIVNLMLLVNGASAGAIFLVIFVCSGFICSWYGASFEGLRPVLNILILSTTFGSVASVYIQELISMSKNWLAFIVTLTKNLLIIIIGSVLIKYYMVGGALSFSYSTLISNLLYIVFLAFIYKRSRK